MMNGHKEAKKENHTEIKKNGLFKKDLTEINVQNDQK